MKKIELSIIIGLIVSILLSGFSSFAAECESIRSNVLRLHILANSNSKQDQALKIKVRDRILKSSPELFSNQSTLQAAESDIEKNISRIKEIAQQEIIANGYNYKIDAKIVNMYFDTKSYGNYTMPAGKYDALRIYIGNAEGKNWWCVLYPPLCIPAASQKVKIQEKLNSKEINVVKSNKKIEIRFKAVEIFEKFKEMFN